MPPLLLLPSDVPPVALPPLLPVLVDVEDPPEELSPREADVPPLPVRPALEPPTTSVSEPPLLLQARDTPTRKIARLTRDATGFWEQGTQLCIEFSKVRAPSEHTDGVVACRRKCGSRADLAPARQATANPRRVVIVLSKGTERGDLGLSILDLCRFHTGSGARRLRGVPCPLRTSDRPNGRPMNSR